MRVRDRTKFLKNFDRRREKLLTIQEDKHSNNYDYIERELSQMHHILCKLLHFQSKEHMDLNKLFEFMINDNENE